MVYPPRLCDNHREIAARYLSELSPEQRQPILDELAGRFLAEKRGMKPVYDEIRFLHSLCKLMRRGKFQLNLGIGVRDGRGRKKPDSKMPATKSAQLPRETDEQRRKRKEVSKAQIAEMRKRLGMKAITIKQ